VVAPALVWEGLTADAQAGAIRLMANLASNLVARNTVSTHLEFGPCHHDSHPQKSERNISIAKP
jgi:hypothetical protein